MKAPSWFPYGTAPSPEQKKAWQDAMLAMLEGWNSDQVFVYGTAPEIMARQDAIMWNVKQFKRAARDTDLKLALMCAEVLKIDKAQIDALWALIFN